ncbi:MAG: hypothetical protein U0231_13840 [Nitrospiraceae bacterium]
MPENRPHISEFDWRLTSFEGSRREQLRRWAQLPLEDILLAIEEMQDIAQQLGTAPVYEQGESVRGASVSEQSVQYENGNTQYDLELSGCTPEPLMLGGLHTGSLGHYLAALGVLHAATQMNGDIAIRGCWKDERFLVCGPTAVLNREALCTYLLKSEAGSIRAMVGSCPNCSKNDSDAIPKARGMQI